MQSYLRRLLRDRGQAPPVIHAQLRRFGFTFAYSTIHLALVEIDQSNDMPRADVERPEAVANHPQRNSAYIARFFREQCGIGISSVKNLRIAKAKRLIETTELTVREVADRTGFSDSNALIRGFKANEGVTPGEYKAALHDPANGTQGGSA